MVSLVAIVIGCLFEGQATSLSLPTSSPSSVSLVQLLDGFLASLPNSTTPVISPEVNDISEAQAIPPSWKEYQDPEVGISFRYPASYKESRDTPDNIPGLNCSAKNTICFAMRKEGGKEDGYSVTTLLSLTVSRNVSAFSCLSPADKRAPADSVTKIGGRLFRDSDCSGVGLGTGTVCARYDLFADGSCYELIPQIFMGCGGTSGKDYEGCGEEATEQERNLDKVVSTFKLTKAISEIDPGSPVPRQIIYTLPLGYTPYTLHDGQVSISFEYPDDPDWNFVDTQYEHSLTGRIALGGAQINDRRFIAISFNPGVAAFNLQQESSFTHFMLNDTLGQGYGLNGDQRLPDMPKGMWKVGGGAGVSGYFVMRYGVMGRVNGTLALSVTICHTYTCTVAPPQEILIEFLDLNNEIARHFLSSLSIHIPGETHTITAEGKLSGP